MYETKDALTSSNASFVYMFVYLYFVYTSLYYSPHTFLLDIYCLADFLQYFQSLPILFQLSFREIV